MCLLSDTQKCTHCYDPNGLFQYNCVPVCPDGFYMTNGVCKPCSLNCKRCNYSNDCDICIDNNYKKSNSCVPDCGESWVLVSDICQPCTSPCLKCNPNNLRICNECPDNFYLYNKTCVGVCPPKFYPNIKVCDPCSEGCHYCGTAVKCDQCSSGFLYYQGKCYKFCPETTYAVSTNCIDCNIGNCITCNVEKQCLKCKDNFFLYKFKCFEKCPKGYYPKNDKCEKCMYPCLDCEEKNVTSANNTVIKKLVCKECPEGYIFTNDKCDDSCEVNYVKKNSRCEQCKDTNCIKCRSTDLNVCNACKDNYYIKQGKLCVLDCGIGYYPDGKRCKNCKDTCNKCESLNKCLECKQPYKLLLNICYRNCPIGSIEINNNPGLCKLCNSERCKECLATNTNECVDCRSTYVLYNGLCKIDCPEGYTKDSSRICKPCTVNKCRNCSQRVNLCIDCFDNMYVFENKCIILCPKGTKPDDSKKICVPCTEDYCEKCSVNEANCEECLENYYLLKSGDCSPICPAGTYENNNSHPKRCKDCNPNCAKCDELECKICESGLFLYNKICIQTCPIGYGIFKNRCVKCIDNINCMKCVDNDLEKCLVCVNSKNLYLAKCIDTCPEGFIMKSINLNSVLNISNGSNNDNPTTLICVACDTFCKKCTSPTSCIDCQNNYDLINGICKPKCLDKTTRINGICVPCETGDYCKICKSSDLSKCAICIEGNYLYNESCVTHCPNNYYASNKHCKPCISGCKICNKDTECKICKPRLALYNKICVSPCPDGYFKNNKTGRCEKCNRYCLKCNSYRICTICDNNYFLQQNKCVVRCDEEYFIDINDNHSLPNVRKTTKHCKPCSDNCIKCKDANTCDVCRLPYFTIPK